MSFGELLNSLKINKNLMYGVIIGGILVLVLVIKFAIKKKCCPLLNRMTGKCVDDSCVINKSNNDVCSQKTEILDQTKTDIQQQKESVLNENTPTPTMIQEVTLTEDNSENVNKNIEVHEETNESN